MSKSISLGLIDFIVTIILDHGIFDIVKVDTFATIYVYTFVV